MKIELLRKLFQKDVLIPIRHREHPVRLYLVGAIVLFVVGFILSLLLSAPRSFPLNTRIEIAEGGSVRSITAQLAEQNVVRSKIALQAVLAVQHSFDSIKAGVYTFTEKENVFGIAESIISGAEGTPLIRVTIPEGLRGEDLVTIFAEAGLENEQGIGAADFDTHLGFLYPDTYFVPESYTFTDMMELMLETYEKKISPLRDSFGDFSEKEIITLASILEREAKDETSKRIVAGILLSRLEIGMALQVDASFSYLLDKESAELTLEDLEIDSPYNTYLYPGLPPTPIANPGTESIEAVLHPEETEYLYYLTAPDGTFYYAETFEEHKRNKERYLR